MRRCPKSPCVTDGYGLRPSCGRTGAGRRVLQSPHSLKQAFSGRSPCGAGLRLSASLRPTKPRSRFLFANGRTFSLLPQPCTSSLPPFFPEASCVRSPLDPSWQTSGYRAAPGSSQPKAHKKGLRHHHRPFTVFRSLLQAIAQTPSPWRLPGSRLCKRHAAPAEKRPALPPGTGPSAGCSCCPGPPASGCRRH